MKQHYNLKALGKGGDFPVSVSVHCTQYQARRIYDALSYACATESVGSVPLTRCRFKGV